VDKVLTLRGGPELVAYWAQLGSLIELIAGVALAGVGTGISVLVAQTEGPERQRALFRESVRLGLAVSAPVMLAAVAIAVLFPGALGGAGFTPTLLALAAASGCIAVIPGMLNGYWLGLQRRGRMLALVAASALLQLAAAAAAPPSQVLAAIALAQAVPALAALSAMGPAGRTPEFEHDRRLLRGYIGPGLVIGVLSPLSMMVAREIVSAELSWHEAGLLQALWRVSDWVALLAGGVMAVQFLPRLSAAWRTEGFAVELRRAALVTLLPAAAAFAVLLALQRPVFALLYDASFRMSDTAVALFFAGTLARIVSWLPLYALYASRRTAPIMAGEILSLPLFVALLAAYPGPLTLEASGALWLLAYVAYGLFNLWMVRRG
jgi:O-antigen/teichoic acid export membrane protein